VGTSDPYKAGIAEALKRFPVDRGRPHLSWSILQSNEPQLTAEVTSETIRTIAQSDENRRLLEELALISMMGVPLTVHGRLLGALVVASCRPERRYTAADLHFLEEVGRRAALALENARLYRAAQQAVQARDQVLGIVAHDLRNPLDTILMQATLLRRRGGEPERIERAASRINRLIQDLLDVTRMEAGRLSIDPARVRAQQVILDSLEAQLATLSSSALEARLDVTPELPEIWGDRDRLLQVFENLMGNAAKFTGAGGRITIGARAREEEVLFWVADTGIGISAEDLPHVFDRFWQARKGERRGSGLGLPIVKGVVEAHGGHVWVESAPGRGSTFYFTVPAAPPVVAPAGEAPATTEQKDSADDSGASVTKAAKHRMVDEQHQGSPDDRDDGAIDVEPAGPRHSEEPEQPPTDDRANDSKQNVDDDPLASAVYDLAGNETGNESENDPRKQ
jgi:signal transduction histidine kinase